MPNTRAEKIRQRLFPDVVTFEPSRGGYTSIPFVLRRAMFLFGPRAWQVYCYILMRLGPEGIGWLSLSEIAWDLDFRNTAKLKPYIDRLVKDGWLQRKTSKSREYFIAPDPIVVLKRLHEKDPFPEERLEAIDEVLESLKWPSLAETPEPVMLFGLVMPPGPNKPASDDQPDPTSINPFDSMLGKGPVPNSSDGSSGSTPRT